jgi:hypothetical protein
VTISPAEQAKWAHGRYAAIVGLLLFVLLLFPFALAKTEFFVRHSSYFYNAVMYDKYSISGNRADLLLVGDSALLSGLVPAVIERVTGLTTYNLGVPLGSFSAHPDLIIENYLAHNEKPKIIILYLGVNAHVSDTKWDRGYEGAVTLLWHDTLRRNLEYYAKDPRKLFAISATLLKTFISGFAIRPESWQTIRNYLIVEKGFLPTDAISRPSALKPGELSPIEVVADTQYIDEFKSKFAKAGYRVLVATSPVPDCDPLFDAVVRAYKGVLDIEPYVFPCAGFTSEGRFHMFRWAAERNSQIFAEALKARIAARVSE